MRFGFRIFTVLAVSILCLSGSFVSGSGIAASPLVKVEYNANVSFQTIEGIGGFGFRNTNWTEPSLWWVYNWNNLPTDGLWSEPSSWWTDSWGDMVINDLGFAITRNEWYPPSTEAMKQPVDWEQQKPYAQKFHQFAKSSGKPLRQIISIFSPPASMKDAKSGRLLPENYDEFGLWVAECITSYKNAGVEVYAVSLQSEPSVNYSLLYNTCPYTPAEYAAMVKVVAPIVKGIHPSVKIMGPEEMIWESSQWPSSYGKALLDDPKALKWLDIIAVHSYTNAWQTGPSDPDAEAFQMKQVYQNYREAGKPIWTTESNPWAIHWLAGMLMAESIYNSFYYGNTSVWMSHMISGNPGQPFVEYYSITNHLEEKSPKYYALRQFSKYIRPGAVRIETSSTNNDILAIGFKHTPEKSLTLVLINKSRNSLHVKLDGNLKIKLNMERSSANEQAVNTGTTSSSNSHLILPPQSITTLYSRM
jgi:O-glycosyl hydrolase